MGDDHKIGGKLLKIGAVVIPCGLLFPKHVLLFLTVPLVPVVVYSLIYSYLEYRKETRA